jgi:ATP-binding cassette, subfamily B, bacterial PglK
MEVVRQLWQLFNRRERIQALLLLFTMICRAAVVTAGVAGIMPFMSLVADPELIHRNAHLAAAYEWMGFESLHSFMIVAGLALIALIIVSNGVSALTTYGTVRFSWGMNHRLSMRLLEGYLRQPYGFFVKRNSASLHKTLLSEIGVVVTSVVKPLMDIGARMLVVGALLALIVLIDPLLAVLSAGILGGAYGAVYMMIKKRQRRLGKDRVEANRMRFKIANEVFGGIKDVKVLQKEDAFLRRFRPASWRFAKTNSSNAIISQLPNYLLDTIAFGGIVMVVLYFLSRGEGVVQILPVISLYAFAGYRLMPELKTLFSDFAKIRFNSAALDDLLADYRTLPAEEDTGAAFRMPFGQSIKIERVSFAYEDSARPALACVSLEIGKNQTVGLVGASGSGKTTLVDLLLGLYEPAEGTIYVDGVPLTSDRLSGWRNQVGYVPQTIYLTDDSIAANIAFGCAGLEIDMDRVREAASIAHLDTFIESLPAAYKTVVGERGVRLSGGQRQRIGIARALYHDPAVLIMDEATSALDGATENAVMDAIRDLAGQKTIVLIAHRLTTVETCDVIYMMSEGEVANQGTYDDLISNSVDFRVFAGYQ